MFINDKEWCVAWMFLASKAKRRIALVRVYEKFNLVRQTGAFTFR